MGRNGGRRYQSRARKLHARRNKSTASRGRTSARSAKRKYSADQLAIRCIPSVYSRPMTLASSVKPRALGLARYRGEFPIFRDSIYLNTCSLGALGERSRRKVAEFLDLRSEEHTSELQSLAYLVCRLLLEKKKKTQKNYKIITV